MPRTTNGRTRHPGVEGGQDASCPPDTSGIAKPGRPEHREVWRRLRRHFLSIAQVPGALRRSYAVSRKGFSPDDDFRICRGGGNDDEAYTTGSYNTSAPQVHVLVWRSISDVTTLQELCTA